MDDGFQGAIISVGPETDQVLGYHGIDDDIIPRLRVLAQTVKSSHWKFKLRDPQYKLTTEQAVDIAEAMMNDFMRKPGIEFQKVILENFDLYVYSLLILYQLVVTVIQDGSCFSSICSRFSYLHLIFQLIFREGAWSRFQS